MPLGVWGWYEVGIISCEWKESISFYNDSSIKIKIEFFGDKSNQENHFTVNRPVNFIEKKPLAPSIHSCIYWFIYSTNICWVLMMSKAYCVHQLHFIHTVLWMSFGNRASKTRTGNSTTTAAAAINACESLMCQALLEKPHCQDCFHQCGKREIPMSILQTKYWDIYAYHEAVKCVCSGIKKKKRSKFSFPVQRDVIIKVMINKERTWKNLK